MSDVPVVVLLLCLAIYFFPFVFCMVWAVEFMEEFGKTKQKELIPKIIGLVFIAFIPLFNIGPPLYMFEKTGLFSKENK